MRLHLKLFNGILLASSVAFVGCSKTTISEIQALDPEEVVVKSETNVAQEKKAKAPQEKDEPIKKLAQSDSTDTKPSVDSKPATAKKTSSESDAEKAANAADELAKRNKLAKEELTALDREYKKAHSIWKAKQRSAKTAEQRKTWNDSDPKKEFGKEYVALAEKFSGTETTRQILLAGLRNGTGESKANISNQLFELASMDSGTLASDRIMVTLARSGAPETQKKIAEKILANASANPTSESAERMLSGLMQVAGLDKERNEAAQMLLDHADMDVRSNKSAKTLIKIATSASGTAQTTALSRLTEHHINNPGILAIMKRLSPSETNENWLKEVCRKATDGKVKSNAAISLSNLINRRDSYRNFYGDAEPAVRNRLDKEMLAYLDKTPDPNEMTLIETTLEDYVKDNEKLIESVKKQLFVVQNLSIGKQAPEITANDLDGVEFNLSDYRGKVVFLDFWGDW